MSERSIHLTVIEPPDQPHSGRWYRIDGLEDDGVEITINVTWDQGGNGGPEPRIQRVIFDGNNVAATHLRAVPLGEIERLLRTAMLARDSVSGEIQIRPPSVHRRLREETDVSFAHRVAVAYRYYASKTAAPAVAIAEASGVPVATVRRWIREARLQGQLEPGRRGKAG